MEKFVVFQRADNKRRVAINVELIISLEDCSTETTELTAIKVVSSGLRNEYIVEQEFGEVLNEIRLALGEIKEYQV